MQEWKEDLAFKAATGLAVLAVVLVFIDGWLFLSNGSIRGDVIARQQYLNQSVQLSRLNQDLVNTLGSAALRGNQAIRELLAASGITIMQAPQPTPAPAATSTPAPASGAAQPSAPAAAGPTTPIQPPPDKPPLRK